MFARLDRGDRNDGVVVVGCCDCNRIDALFLFEHLAEILVAFGFWVLVDDLGGVIPIHIAQGYDVLTADIVEVRGALPTKTDARDVKFFIRRNPAWPADHMTRQDQETAYRRGSGKKSAAGKSAPPLPSPPRCGGGAGPGLL